MRPFRTPTTMLRCFMPPAPSSAVVVACDHFLPPGKEPLLHEFHVVVRFEETGRHVRLRTDRCEPIKLLHMLPLTTTNPTWEDVEVVAKMFEPGKRLRFHSWALLVCLQRPEYGFDPMDVAVQPRAIEVLHGPAPRVRLEALEGGRV